MSTKRLHQQIQFIIEIDRLKQVLRQTLLTDNSRHGVTRDRVMKRVAPVETGAPELWSFVQQLIEDCVATGYLQEAPAVIASHSD